MPRLDHTVLSTDSPTNVGGGGGGKSNPTSRPLFVRLPYSAPYFHLFNLTGLHSTTVKRTARTQFPPKLPLPNILNLRSPPKVKKFTEKLSFVHRVCLDNLIIVIYLLYRLVFSLILVTFPYKLLAHCASNSLKSQGSENRKWR